MSALFEVIIGILSVVLENWDELGFRYKIVILTIILIGLIAILILFNY